MVNKFFVCILLFGSFFCEAQLLLTWKELQLTQFEIIAKGEDVGLYKAKFQKSIEAFENKEVVIAGFIVPVDIESNTYALSLNPFTSCFFCGNAGPSTVIELSFIKQQGKFLVDQYVIVKGIFSLNRGNPNELFFKISEAKIHG